MNTQPGDEPRVLLADDEPFYMEWASDYIESKGCVAEFAESVDEAISKLIDRKYFLLIVDLNIPMTRLPDRFDEEHSDTYASHPGLYIADVARNSGYSEREVIIYSVSVSKQIEEAANRLYCNYVPKGHPVILKREIDHAIESFNRKRAQR